MTNTHVRFDDSPTWAAIDSGTSWNGWAVPRITVEVQAELVSWLTAQDGPSTSSEVAALVPDADGLVTVDLGLCFWWCDSNGGTDGEE